LVLKLPASWAVDDPLLGLSVSKQLPFWGFVEGALGLEKMFFQ
jgi:hypothetical protein